MERIEAPEKLPDNIRFTFNKAEESGNDVLSVRKLYKSFPGKNLFSSLSFEVKKRDRLLIIGDNGSGKSTLLKILNRTLTPDSGVYEYGYNVHVGYYDQENQNLHTDLTVIDELWNTYPNMTQTEIRSTLALFLFKGDDIFKEVSVLSGGEKARLTLAKLMLSKVNLLILDEPTNHLDIESREVLENAIERFDATVIAVSHDRYFINKIATRILDFKDGSVTDYIGTYKQYLSYLQNTSSDSKNDFEKEEKIMSSAKAQYLASKQEAQLKRKQENAIKKYNAELEKIEAELADIETEINSEAIASDHVKLSELYQKSQELEERMLFIYEELDKLGKL
jgi:ATP-binding cassette subfamily F protein 3